MNKAMQKLGPLPVWAWAAVGAGMVTLVYVWRRAGSKGAAQAKSQAAGAAQGAATPYGPPNNNFIQPLLVNLGAQAENLPPPGQQGGGVNASPGTVINIPKGHYGIANMAGVTPLPYVSPGS